MLTVGVLGPCSVFGLVVEDHVCRGDDGVRSLWTVETADE
jgi:hypothetical protein